MEVSREGHSGLYTMHFSNIFPPEQTEGSSSGKPATPSSSGSSSSLAEFSQWHILIRMSVENDICFVKGDAKVFSPTPSLASPAARGVCSPAAGGGGSAPVRATQDGIPIVLIHQKERKCQVLIEGTYRVCDFTDQSSAFRLEVHLERLEAAVLGLSPEPPQTPPVVTDGDGGGNGGGPRRDANGDFLNVVLSCGGHKSCGWHMGVVQVTSDGEKVATSSPLHFLLKPYYGKRCTTCLDPVYAIGYGCSACGVTRYCSRECLNGHMKKGHGVLCPLLHQKYSTRSGSVATEVSDDTRLVAWWRGMENSYYSILVDSGSTLGCAVEFTICTLKSPQTEGLQFRFITPSAATKTALPADDEVIDFSCVLLREVSRSAVLEGCAALSSACLHYLFLFSPSAEITIQSHLLFYTAFHCEELEGPISTVEEYVTYARPMHCLAVLQVEYALRSSISTEFWRRIRTARDATLSLCALNDCEPCHGVEGMRAVVDQQQCEAMLLLSKIYLMMATRCKEDHMRWLSEGERLLRQCLSRRAVKADDRIHATYCFRLAVYLLLFQDDARSEEAVQLRAQGEELLKNADAADKAVIGRTRNPS